MIFRKIRFECPTNSASVFSTNECARDRMDLLIYDSKLHGEDFGQVFQNIIRFPKTEMDRDFKMEHLASVYEKLPILHLRESAMQKRSSDCSMIKLIEIPK